MVCVLTIDNIPLMEGIECQEDLRGIKLAPAYYITYCSSESLSLRESSPNSSPPGQY